MVSFRWFKTDESPRDKTWWCNVWFHKWAEWGPLQALRWTITHPSLNPRAPRIARKENLVQQRRCQRCGAIGIRTLKRLHGTQITAGGGMFEGDGIVNIPTRQEQP